MSECASGESCGACAQPPPKTPIQREIVRNSPAAPFRHGGMTGASRTQFTPPFHFMNTTTRPAAPNAKSSKSITLLQMLTVIAAAGIAVSLLCRYFL